LVQIIKPGSQNNNQGPDFSNAKIRIGKTTWAGNVELHIRSSDWNIHKHSVDPNFDNIILQVVWQNDRDIKDKNGVIVPAIELKSRVSKILLEKYKSLMSASHFIPCEKSVPAVNRGCCLSHLKDDNDIFVALPFQD